MAAPPTLGSLKLAATTSTLHALPLICLLIHAQQQGPQSRLREER